MSAAAGDNAGAGADIELPAGHTGAERAACCADFYSSPTVRMLLGDSLHPGGTDLTRELLSSVSATPGERLLDLGAGLGTSALLAAGELGCRVTGVDFSAANAERARSAAAEAGLEEVDVVIADATDLPFPDGSFDLVLCECVYSTFADKPAAANEMLRVTRPGGRLALSDMTLESDDLEPELRSLLATVACIGDAVPAGRLEGLLTTAGFGEVHTDDASWALEEMAQRVRRRLIALRVAGKLAPQQLGRFDLEAAKDLADRALAAIRDGTVRYVTLTAVRPTEDR